MFETNDFLSDISRMVSVDVETAGPNPADYALLSIGACTLTQPRETFYAELKPVSEKVDPGALEVHKLDLGRLAVEGLDPKSGLESMAYWLKNTILDERGPLFLGFNSPFDWMFLNDYFHRFLGFNPFGHSSLDIKSFVMGLKRVPWASTSMKTLTDKPLRHNALEDAIDQANLFINLLDSEGYRFDKM
jgi:DNA polymerase III epsilon subunit-like protein